MLAEAQLYRSGDSHYISVPTCRQQRKARPRMARTLTNEIIDAAIEGFEAQKRRIDDQIADLRSIRDGGSSQPRIPATAPRQKRKLSPEAIRRIREGQQRRWVKVRGEATPSAPSASKPAKKKRRLSPEGRKAIQDALRRRWAQKRAEAEGPKPATKKAPRRKAAKAAKRPAPKKAAAKSVPAASPQSGGE